MGIDKAKTGKDKEGTGLGKNEIDVARIPGLLFVDIINDQEKG